MIRGGRGLLAAALALLLAACATPPLRSRGDATMLGEQAAREQALAGVDRWTLQGRLSVSDGKGGGGTGNLEWTQDGARYAFTVRVPVTGKTVFRLSGDNDGALLEGLEQGPMHGPDAESLMQRALGWHVPLRELRAWVLGLRAPGSDAELAFGPDRLPSLLQQDGWSVEYRRWDAQRQPPLPATVFASEAPYKVRLSIESWQLGAH